MSVGESNGERITHVSLGLCKLRILRLEYNQTVLEVYNLVVEVRGLSLLEYISSVPGLRVFPLRLTSWLGAAVVVPCTRALSKAASDLAKSATSCWIRVSSAAFSNRILVWACPVPENLDCPISSSATTHQLT